MVKKLILGLLACGLCFFGALSFLAGCVGISDVSELETTSALLLEDGRGYHVSQLTVLEPIHYGQQEDALWTRATVRTLDQGTVSVAFVVEAEDDELWGRLKDWSGEQPVILDCVVQVDLYPGSDDVPSPAPDAVMDALTADGQLPVLEDLYLTFFTSTTKEAGMILTISRWLFWICGLLAVGLGLLMFRSVGKKARKPAATPVAVHPSQVQKQLESYQTLLDQGLITQKEFDEKRRQILRR